MRRRKLGRGVTCESGAAERRQQNPRASALVRGLRRVGCGPARTPTPVRPTATVTVTPTEMLTASPTLMLPSGSCGDGLLEPGETCTSCPDGLPARRLHPERHDQHLRHRGEQQPAADQCRRRARLPQQRHQHSRQRERHGRPPARTVCASAADHLLQSTISITRWTSQAPAAQDCRPPPAPSHRALRHRSEAAHAPTVADLSCVVTRCADATGDIAGCGWPPPLSPDVEESHGRSPLARAATHPAIAVMLLAAAPARRAAAEGPKPAAPAANRRSPRPVAMACWAAKRPARAAPPTANQAPARPRAAAKSSSS